MGSCGDGPCSAGEAALCRSGASARHGGSEEASGESLAAQRGAALGCGALIAALRSASSLSELRLADSDLGPRGAAALCAALPSGARLTRLDVSGNGIGSEGVRAICELDCALRAVNVSRNAMGDHGAAWLAAMVRRSATLREVRAADNGVGDAGAAALGGALSESSIVVELDLSWNDIGAAGCRALGEAMKRGTLGRLDLGHCRIGEQGATVIWAALLGSRVSALRMGGNFFPHSAALLAGLVCREGLVSLDVDFNFNDEEGAIFGSVTKLDMEMKARPMVEVRGFCGAEKFTGWRLNGQNMERKQMMKELRKELNRQPG
eukprot:Selendium_serpulae@DN8267_c0_g1_i1.p2